MEEKISFQSDGLKLAGIVNTPEDLRPGERRPAFVVLHGFGGNKDGQGQTVVAKQFTQWGYVTLRIDFRGCGESEGEHGRIICLDQVADTRNAITYLATRPEVDPNRIALVGSSFGAAVAVFTGGADQPAELHLLSDVDHFTFNEENPRLTRIVSEWLARYFPVQK